jgi:hypothetical protein
MRSLHRQGVITYHVHAVVTARIRYLAGESVCHKMPASCQIKGDDLPRGGMQLMTWNTDNGQTGVGRCRGGLTDA